MAPRTWELYTQQFSLYLCTYHGALQNYVFNNVPDKCNEKMVYNKNTEWAIGPHSVYTTLLSKITCGDVINYIGKC